ncbi:stage III sporulation protein AG [Fonticella tunisiensis]|uniref:Stage III sporulation protein AG n=1 Tax=Fonticella tunisiensis TaxID=1096341 RepID=A0A4R7KSJ5_9CLOT|nr:stage III sporulation protein AG [Fonticella tunisiensis]TDT61948.1 stage III sporulation protein AG [Fonticella tunisiensis]
MDFKKLQEKFKDTKKLMYYLLIAILLGVLLMLIGNVTTSLNSSSLGEKDKKNTIQVNTNTAAGTPSTYEDKLKKELTDTLSQIEGVGKVVVTINFEEGYEEVPVMNKNNSDRRIEEKDSNGGTRITTEKTDSSNAVIVNDGSGSKVVITRRINPKVAGVIVVAEGAENRKLRDDLILAVRTVLNVQEHKVAVMPMKKK